MSRVVELKFCFIVCSDVRLVINGSEVECGDVLRKDDTDVALAPTYVFVRPQSRAKSRAESDFKMLASCCS
jgi:hypothetical protein